MKPIGGVRETYSYVLEDPMVGIGTLVTYLVGKFYVRVLAERWYLKEIDVGLDLNEEPLKENDVDDYPTPIIKLPQAY